MPFQDQHLEEQNCQEVEGDTLPRILRGMRGPKGADSCLFEWEMRKKRKPDVRARWAGVDGLRGALSGWFVGRFSLKNKALLKIC